MFDNRETVNTAQESKQTELHILNLSNTEYIRPLLLLCECASDAASWLASEQQRLGILMKNMAMVLTVQSLDMIFYFLNICQIWGVFIPAGSRPSRKQNF